MSEQLYHCQNCNYEWYYPYSDGRCCADCGSENIYRYPEPKFRPQQWVKYRPYGALYRARTAQVAEVRSDDCGGWMYLLLRNLEDSCVLAEFPEDMIKVE